MTFAVLLSLLSHSLSNTLAGGQFCLRAVHPISVSHLTQCQPSFVLSVTRHFLTPQAPRVTLIPLPRFELP